MSSVSCGRRANTLARLENSCVVSHLLQAGQVLPCDWAVAAGLGVCTRVGA